MWRSRHGRRSFAIGRTRTQVNAICVFPTRMPVSSKVSRTAASASPRARDVVVPRRPWRALRAADPFRPKDADRRHRASTAGKHESPRQERVTRAALAHQHARRVALAAHQHQRRGILRPQHRPVGIGRIELKRILASGQRRPLRARGMLRLVTAAALFSSSSASSKRRPPVSGAASARRTVIVSPRR